MTAFVDSGGSRRKRAISVEYLARAVPASVPPDSPALVVWCAAENVLVAVDINLKPLGTCYSGQATTHGQHEPPQPPNSPRGYPDRHAPVTPGRSWDADADDAGAIRRPYPQARRTGMYKLQKGQESV